MNNENIIITAENLGYCYPGQKETIINNLNFTIKKGQRIAITGKSGIGKSTILKLFAGLLHNYSGTIVNNSLCQGYMFQDAYLYPWLNVYDNVSLGLRILKRKPQRERVMEMLKWAGIEDYAFRSVGSLSGGQKQRVALVRTLITKPDIIMLDEAFSSLDTETAEQLKTDIIEYSKQKSVALLLVTHNYSEAFNMADEVFYLKHQIVSDEKHTLLQSIEEESGQALKKSEGEYKKYKNKEMDISFLSSNNSRLLQLQNTDC